MIQIDMPMPKNCLDCPACTHMLCAIPINGKKWGENDVREFGQGRPKWCPLKEQEATMVIESENMYTGLPITHCPKCGKSLDRYLYGRRQEGEINFCPYCGQAVKWNG